MDSLILQTVVGLVFTFAVASAVVSVLTEGTARLIGLRGEYLLRGIRSLVDEENNFELGWRDVLRRTSEKPRQDAPADPMVTKIVDQPMVARTADKGSIPKDAGNAKLSAKDRRCLPSYVSGRSFARALIGIVVPDLDGKTSIDDIKGNVGALDDGNPIKKPLLSLLAEAGQDVAKFRESVEEWYDDHMARVSGWYKRHVRWISLGIGALVVVIFNVNAVEITRSFYADEALRASVVAQAIDASACQNKEPATCLNDVRAEIRDVRASGLPIGWGVVEECAAPTTCNWLQRHGLSAPEAGFGQDLQALLLVLVGWALMVVATLPGARFWFDALSRLGSLRSTGPKPASR
jgi:hypothetical protein